jgi:translation initiation factor 1
MPGENSKLVYSTERTVQRREKPADGALQPCLSPDHQKITVRLDRKSRGGKSVTVIEGLRVPQKKRTALLKQLKSRLGTGGTVKGAIIEIQGNHCDAIISALKKMGFTPKRSGG